MQHSTDTNLKEEEKFFITCKHQCPYSRPTLLSLIVLTDFVYSLIFAREKHRIGRRVLLMARPHLQQIVARSGDILLQVWTRLYASCHLAVDKGNLQNFTATSIG